MAVADARKGGYDFWSGEYKLQFGSNDNQKYHTFRHTDAMGLDRSLVESSVKDNFIKTSKNFTPGKPYNQTITVGRHKLQYTAFSLKRGKINIGRIHHVKD